MRNEWSGQPRLPASLRDLLSPTGTGPDSQGIFQDGVEVTQAGKRGGFPWWRRSGFEGISVGRIAAARSAAALTTAELRLTIASEANWELHLRRVTPRDQVRIGSTQSACRLQRAPDHRLRSIYRNVLFDAVQLPPNNGLGRGAVDIPQHLRRRGEPPLADEPIGAIAHRRIKRVARHFAGYRRAVRQPEHHHAPGPARRQAGRRYAADPSLAGRGTHRDGAG